MSDKPFTDEYVKKAFDGQKIWNEVCNKVADDLICANNYRALLSRIGQPAVDALMSGDDNVGVYRGIGLLGSGHRIDKPEKQEPTDEQ